MLNTFYTTPANQGQATEVSYASTSSGLVVRRILDRSLGLGNPERETYAVSKIKKDDDGEYWQSEPSNARWKKVAYAKVLELFDPE